MSQAEVIFLEQVRAMRESAAHARHLAETITAKEAVEQLLRAADELEREATLLQARATELSENVAKNRAVAHEIKSLVGEIKAASSKRVDDEYERLNLEWMALSRRATAAFQTLADGNSLELFQEIEARAAEIVQRMKKLRGED